MDRWEPSYLDDGEYDNYYVALVDEEGYAIHTHPIPFATHREAVRAADRLNARDAKERT